MANTYNEPGFTYNDAGSQFNLLGTAPAVTGVTAALRVDLQLAGVWTNITDHVFTTEKVQIRRGRSSETSSPQASSASLVLNNTDGRFTPRNSAGLYYPNFTRNTPIRIGVGTPPQGAALGNQATSINAPAVVAERSGLAVAAWAQTRNTVPIWTLPVAYTADVGTTAGTFAQLRSAHLAVGSAGTVGAAVTTSTQGAPSAGLQVFIPGASPTIVSATATMNSGNPNSGYNGCEVGPYTSAAVGDVFLVIAMWSADLMDQMSCPPQDTTVSSEWMLVADSGPVVGPRLVAWVKYVNKAEAGVRIKFPADINAATDDGAVMYQITGADAYNPRFVGACSDITQSATDAWSEVRTTVTCGSTLRQMGQGNPPTASVLRRLGKQAFAYWPLETGTLSGSNSALPATAGTANAQIFGSYAPGNSTVYPQSLALGTFTSDNVVGRVPDTRAGANVASGVYAAVSVVAAPTTAGGALLMANLTNTGASTAASNIWLEYTSATSTTLKIQSGTGVVTSVVVMLVPTMVAPFAPVWFINWAPNVANPLTQIDISAGFVDSTSGQLNVYGVFTQTITAGAVNAAWIGRTPSGTVNFNNGLVGGHLAVVTANVNQGTVFTNPITPTAYAYAGLSGYIGELEHDRMLRVAQEQSQPVAMLRQATNDGGFKGGLYEMGAQIPSTPLGVINLCADTDCGELADARPGGLLYRSVGALSGQAAVATLDYTTGTISAPLVPSDDDSLTRNDVTAANVNGSSAENIANTGPLGVLTVGQYATTQTVDVHSQGRDLPDIASWLVNLGTINEPRFNQVVIPLEASSAANAQVYAAIDIGQRVHLQNLPAWCGAASVDGIVIGCSEILGPVNEWWVTLTLEPYSGYAVIVLDGGVGFGELDSHRLGLNGIL